MLLKLSESCITTQTRTIDITKRTFYQNNTQLIQHMKNSDTQTPKEHFFTRLIYCRITELLKCNMYFTERETEALCPYGRTFVTLCPCGIVPVCWLGLMPADTVIPLESCSHSLALKYLQSLMVFENVAYWECFVLQKNMKIPHSNTGIIKHIKPYYTNANS